ncbi:pallilysin-related adhesin [Spirochaeta thermophila]|uniref:Pallilysin beta barrel domain-containing protein n=1 Tax=Winmispira thermophila (strain ATCC 49972 / DSM 6192 / RI 19.B1) TaxID=665571 RepID=E0RSF8_WINT6|nr:pallilysin-related adhesin [Spirochaeta thermophila]ADN01945.1 hypothetical protein STHERM_c09990 [Spirochaeta thermophila DSM 6192]
MHATRPLQIISLAVFLILLSCAPTPGGRRSSPGSLPILEQETRFVSLSPQEHPNEQESEGLFAKPYISLPESSQVITVLTVQLDMDGEEEQLVAYKTSPQPATPITLSVADYDSIRDVYREVWKTSLPMTSPYFFSMEAIDLTGDHTPELVVQGITERGDLNLQIFRRTLSPWGLSLSYRSVLSITTQGKVEIVRHERSTAYAEGQTTGQAFPVRVTTERTDEGGTIIQTITTYEWDVFQEVYTVRATEERALEHRGDTSEELRRLFEGTAEAIATFVAGPWFKEETHEETFLVLDYENREISFYREDIQEIYLWQNSIKNFYRGISIIAQNKTLPGFSISIYLSLQDANTIQISITTPEIRDPSPWNGTYSRFTEGLQRAFFSRSPISPRPLHLSGVFTNETTGGQVIFSDPSRLTWHTEDKSLSGFFTTYAIKEHTILEFLLFEERHTPPTHRLFLVTSSKEETVPLGMKKELVLLPIRLTPFGVEPLPSAVPITLQQIIREQRETPAPTPQ